MVLPVSERKAEQLDAQLSGNRLIQDPKAALHIYPRPEERDPPNKDNQITIGDLHGNAFKLIYVLVRQNILDLSKEDFEELDTLYSQDIKKFEKKHIQRFNEILQRAVIRPDAVGMLRLIGDEVADRGKNDYLTLKVLQKLTRAKVPFEILFSNHGLEFVENYEAIELHEKVQKGEKQKFRPRTLDPSCAKSMLNMQDFIDKNLVEENEILDLIDEVYKPQLKALSYTLSEGKITVYTHAGVGLVVIAGLASKLGVAYNAKSAEALAKTIDHINEAFSLHVLKNEVHNLYDKNILEAQTDQTNEPFEFLTWNRKYEEKLIINPERKAVLENGDKIDFVHGHDSQEETHDNIYVIDDRFGSPHYEQLSGHFKLLLSQEKSRITQRQLYQNAFLKLNAVITDRQKQYDIELKRSAFKIQYSVANASRKATNQELAVLTEILDRTTQGIKDPKDAENLRAYEKLQHSLNTQRAWGKIVGGTVLAFLGTLVTVAAVAVAVTTFGVSTPISALVAGIGISVAVKGAALAAAALGGVALASGTALAHRGQHTNLARSVTQFWKKADHLNKHNPKQKPAPASLKPTK